MAELGRITLRKSLFTEKERFFFNYKSLVVSTFIYESGIHAVKIKNKDGYIIMLPFKGQQIWEAFFDGRSLRMKSLFDEPRDTENFINSYGCFMMHCGALRMGCPGPEDDYQLHGELPYATYPKAELIYGEDEKGIYVGVTGEFEYKKGFADYYRAIPTVKLHEKSSKIDILMDIENLSNYPMELMYMCHVNFSPSDNGEILQTLSWENTDMVVRTTIPDFVKPSKKYLNFLQQLKVNPKETKILKVEDEYDPEICFSFNNVKTDNQGFAHFMQKHEDGKSDYVSYKPEEFPLGTRWILKAKNNKVLGLALPATANSDGYTIEKKKGHVQEILPKTKVSFSVVAGALDEKGTEKMAKEIDIINNK